MRKLLIGALLAVTALATAAVAWSATQQNYEQTYTSKKKGSSTATRFEASATDPDNPEGQQPKPARRVLITFPEGSKVDTRAVTRCNADDNDFASEGERACPTNSLVGRGEADLRNNGGVTFETDVTAFNRKRGLILYIVQPDTGQTVILRPRLRRGPVLDTTVPPTCVLGTFNAATNQCEFNGERSTAGELVLTRFLLVTQRRQSGRGKKRRLYIRTPRACPRNNRWVFSATFTYNDGTSETRDSTTPCRR